MHSRVWLLISLTLVACRPAAPPVDTARLANTLSDGDSVSVGAGICDSVAIPWRATGKAQVRVADTTMHVDSDPAPQSGCAVLVLAPHGLDKAQGLDSAQWGALYWSPRDTHGWLALSDYDADGPMGNSRTLERQGLRCQVEDSFDPDDDSDSTHVPSPWFKQMTFCWRKGS